MKHLYGTYNEKEGTYIVPKGSPTDLESIKQDFEQAEQLAAKKFANNNDATGVTFLHEGNGIKFQICGKCEKEHPSEPLEDYKYRLEQLAELSLPNGLSGGELNVIGPDKSNQI